MAVSGTGLLAGLASAIPGAIQGYQDMKAQDLKKMELEAKSKADSEDRQYKKLTAKLKAAELGQDLEENESGELVLKPRAGLLTPEQKRQEELYMKGFQRGPEGNLGLADWRQKEMDNKQRMESMKFQQAGRKADVFEQESLKQFAKKQVDYTTLERPQLANNLSKIDFAVNILDSRNDISGPGKGLLPQSVRAFTNPDAIKAQEAMQSAIQDTLRPTLGAQFTEKEGERIMNLAFNPSLPAEENKRRALALKSAIEQKIAGTDALYSYIRQNKTVEGFPFEKYGLAQSGMTEQMEAVANEGGPRGLLPKMSSEDAQAMEWARSNPQDPRSKEILKRLGM